MTLSTLPSQSNQIPLIRFSSCTTKTISLVANSPSIILQPNSKRIYALVVNLTDVLVSLICGDSPVRVEEGLPLWIKGSQFIIRFDELFDGKVTAICHRPAKLTIMECEE